MRNRCAIFVIYSPEEELYQSVIYLLNELKTVSTYLIVVVNGNINNKGRQVLKQISDVFIMRENAGFDAGAYKAALQNQEVRKYIESSDELILCNDTFWGPFIPFLDLFKQMEVKKCDFWGINEVNSGIYQMIQSYFLVFRNRILRSGVLDSFFASIDEKSTDYNDALYGYEQGIYLYLSTRGFVSAALHYNPDINLRNMAAALWIEEIPILKKKIVLFGEKDTNFLMCLKYVMNQTEFPLEMILDELKEKNNVEISRNELFNVEGNMKFAAVKHKSIDRQKILQFVMDNKTVYLYGCGQIARLVSMCIPDDKIIGYILTLRDKTEYNGKPVFSYDSVKQLQDVNIIIALGYANTAEVRNNIPDSWNVLELWQ